jgi:hypothetical protein
LGDGKTADGGLMGIEEERIRKLGLAIWRNGCCDAVENSIIGPRDDLDCGGFLGGSWRGRFDFLARYCSGRSGRLAISVALSFCHVVVSWKFCGNFGEKLRNFGFV